MRRPDWLDVFIFGFLVIVVIVIAEIFDNRIDNLEARMATFETIRIEAVAPPEGVSP